MFSIVLAQSPIDILKSILEFIKEYDVWIFGAFLVVLTGFLLYKLFNMFMGKTLPERYKKKAIDVIEEITKLSEAEKVELRRKNDPQVVDMFFEEAHWTVQAWELYTSKELTSSGAVRRLQVNIEILPERYEAIKKGGQFSQFQGKQVR